MYSNINFLKERNRLQEMTLVRDKKIALFTSIGLGIFLCVMVAILSYQLFLTTQFNSVAAQANDGQAQLSRLQTTQSAYLANFKKFTTIKQLIQARGDKWSSITYVYSILPPGNTIDSVNLQADTGSALDFSVKSDDIFAYEKFSQVMQSDAITQSGFALDLGTLSRSKDGTYHIDIILTQSGAPAAKPKTGSAS